MSKDLMFLDVLKTNDLDMHITLICIPIASLQLMLTSGGFAADDE